MTDPPPGPGRSAWTRWRASAVLAVLGIGFTVTAYLLFPQRDQVPTPQYVNFSVDSTADIGLMTYHVRAISASTAEITVSADMYPSAAGYPGTGAATTVLLFLPPEVTPIACETRTCLKLGRTYNWRPDLKFGSTGVAQAVLRVEATTFGYTANGVTASIAIPEVDLRDTNRKATLQVKYDLADARDYDWSSFPTAYVSNSMATWSQDITDGKVAARAAIGVNRVNQDEDSRNTFLAGALLGLAGGALLAAVQEALHANP